MAEAHPTHIKDLLAYHRLVVREAKWDNKGWISYDHFFHQNIAANPAFRWDSLDPSLHLSFFIGNEPLPTVCSHYNELDHRSDECVLAKPSPQDKDKPGKQSFCQLGPSRTSGTKHSTPRICLSWNSGQCIFPGMCEYMHLCHTCHETDHRARDCDLTSANSIYKRPKKLKSGPLSAAKS